LAGAEDGERRHNFFDFDRLHHCTSDGFCESEQMVFALGLGSECFRGFSGVYAHKLFGFTEALRDAAYQMYGFT
jgi:hypothetical protein